jgi:SAM-dependent methyltransferase
MGFSQQRFTVQDRVNRSAWRTRSALRWYDKLSDWTDPGEAAAIAYVRAEVRDQPLLDVGVGGGRTVPLLSRVSPDYTGVDYTPELVAICQRNYPSVQVRVMDARNLAEFEDNSFALVMFSFNGIDSIDSEGRRKVLSEFARVLKPGGLALFSTHNLAGPGYRETFAQASHVSQAENVVEFGINCARALYNLPMAAFNYLRYSPLNREYDGYALRVCAAHRFGTLILYTDIPTQRQQCAEAGLLTEAVFGSNSGAQVSELADVSGENWLHFVARKV